jgi:hypothetical protein
VAGTRQHQRTDGVANLRATDRLLGGTGPLDPRFAELVAHRTHGRQPSADDMFDFGFDLILTGLRHTLHTSRDTQPNR